jgi:hypothetical protein
VLDSTFVRLSNTDPGGAIQCSTACDFFVNGSVFICCSSCKTGGGADFSWVRTCFFTDCCFSRCYAQRTGNGVALSGPTEVSFTVVSLQQCAPIASFTTVGGIQLGHAQIASTFSDVNFTDGYSRIPCISSDLRNMASSVEAVNVTCQRLNVANNTGEFGFYRALANRPWIIKSSNFYNNSLVVLGNVNHFVTPKGSGMTVESCIFSGNLRDIGVGFDTDVNTTVNEKFLVINCVFSGAFPDSNAAKTTDCRSNTVTESWKITTRSCPVDTGLLPTPPCGTEARTPGTYATDIPLASATSAPTEPAIVTELPSLAVTSSDTPLDSAASAPTEPATVTEYLSVAVTSSDIALASAPTEPATVTEYLSAAVTSSDIPLVSAPTEPANIAEIVSPAVASSDVPLDPGVPVGTSTATLPIVGSPRNNDSSGSGVLLGAIAGGASVLVLAGVIIAFLVLRARRKKSPSVPNDATELNVVPMTSLADWSDVVTEMNGIFSGGADEAFTLFEPS